MHGYWEEDLAEHSHGEGFLIICATHSPLLSVREWACRGCGTLLDRDYNAAVNVMVATGLVETSNAGGGRVGRRPAVADPVKQEPAERTPARAGAV